MDRISPRTCCLMITPAAIEIYVGIMIPRPGAAGKLSHLFLNGAIVHLAGYRVLGLSLFIEYTLRLGVNPFGSFQVHGPASRMLCNAALRNDLNDRRQYPRSQKPYGAHYS